MDFDWDKHHKQVPAPAQPERPVNDNPWDNVVPGVCLDPQMFGASREGSTAHNFETTSGPSVSQGTYDPMAGLRPEAPDRPERPDETHGHEEDYRPDRDRDLYQVDPIEGE